MEYFRFHEQQLPFFSENISQLSKKGILVGNLMNHEEGKDKINSFGYIDSIFVAFYKFNPSFQPGPLDFFAELLQHSILQICRNHFAAFAHHFCHFDRKESGSTSDIENSHPFFDIRSQYYLWIMQPSSDANIKPIGKPNGTNTVSRGFHIASWSEAV